MACFWVLDILTVNAKRREKTNWFVALVQLVTLIKYMVVFGLFVVAWLKVACLPELDVERRSRFSTPNAQSPKLKLEPRPNRSATSEHHSDPFQNDKEKVTKKERQEDHYWTNSPPLP